MSKVINGKKYDECTAEEVCEWHREDEFWGLYRKRSGEYFAHCWSGLWGHSYLPLTVDEAKAYAERHMDGEDYEAHFGSVPE